MENKLNIKIILFLVVGSVIIIGGYLLVSELLKDNDNNTQTYLKNYKVNEYIPTYISDEQMAEIYLNEYIQKMYYDVEEAYNLLDKEYRDKKFGSLEGYKSYINSLGDEVYKISTYYKYDAGDYTIFGVTDQNSNLYIFKTKGVMQYSVFLDDYTVEI